MIILNEEPLDPSTNYIDPKTRTAYVDLDIGEGELAHRVRFERKELEALIGALPALAHPDFVNRTHRAVDYVRMLDLINHPETVDALAAAKAASPAALVNELERDKAAFEWLLRERPHVREIKPLESESARDAVLRYADGELESAGCPCPQCTEDVRRKKAAGEQEKAERRAKAFARTRDI